MCEYHGTALSKLEPHGGPYQELGISDIGLKKFNEGLEVLSGIDSRSHVIELRK